MDAFQKHGLDAVLLLVAFEQVAEVIVSDLAYESGLVYLISNL